MNGNGHEKGAKIVIIKKAFDPHCGNLKEAIKSPSFLTLRRIIH